MGLSRFHNFNIVCPFDWIHLEIIIYWIQLGTNHFWSDIDGNCHYFFDLLYCANYTSLNSSKTQGWISKRVKSCYQPSVCWSLRIHAVAGLFTGDRSKDPRKQRRCSHHPPWTAEVVMAVKMPRTSSRPSWPGLGMTTHPTRQSRSRTASSGPRSSSMACSLSGSRVQTRSSRRRTQLRRHWTGSQGMVEMQPLTLGMLGMRIQCPCWWNHRAGGGIAIVGGAD